MFDCYLSYNGHNSYKQQGKALAISSLPQLINTYQGRVVRKNFKKVRHGKRVALMKGSYELPH